MIGYGTRGNTVDWLRETWSVIPLYSDRFEVAQRLSSHGDLQLMDVGIGACRGRREEGRVTGREGLYITLYRLGSLCYRTPASECVVNGNDLLIWDPGAPGSFESREGSAGLTFFFPREAMERRLGRFEPPRNFVPDARRPQTRIFRSHLNSLSELIDQLPEDRLTDVIGSTIDLAHSCLLADRTISPGSASSSVVEQTRRDIDRHLGPERVLPGDTAGRLGIGLRALQDALAAEGTTFTKLLNDTRMERARAMLLSRSGSHSISDVALSLGFYDSAHFSNMFRRTYRMSPREYRNRH